jgi:hypothetical protein
VKLHTRCQQQIRASFQLHFQTAVFQRQEYMGTVGQEDEWIRFFWLDAVDTMRTISAPAEIRIHTVHCLANYAND